MAEQNNGSQEQTEDTGTEQGNGNQNPDDSTKAGTGEGALESILSKLDENGRAAVRSELERARSDAAKARSKSAKYGDIDPERAKAAIAKLDEIEAQSKTDTQKATERASAAEQERDSARKELWRERAGRKHGLPDAFVAMIQGSTEDEVDEHAKNIADELAEARKRPADSVPTAPKPNQSPGSQNSDGFDPEKIAAQALAR